MHGAARIWFVPMPGGLCCPQAQQVVVTYDALVLTSAIYFMGNWESPFKTQDTVDAPFTLRGGNKVTVPLMEQVGHFPFVKQAGLTAIQLPYADNDLSMIAILPDGDIDKLADSLSLDRIQQIQKDMRSAKVDMYLPRFEFQSRYYLAQTLAKMGMPDAFSAKKADFSGMDGKTDLYIGQVITSGHDRGKRSGQHSRSGDGRHDSCGNRYAPLAGGDPTLSRGPAILLHDRAQCDRLDPLHGTRVESVQRIGSRVAGKVT